MEDFAFGLNDSSHLAVDVVYLTNKLLPAIISGNFLDALRDAVNLLLYSVSIWNRLCDIAFFAVSRYHFELVAKEFDVFSSDICYQRFLCG